MSEVSALPRGRFITLEGGEGAGKSTQARRLQGFLAGRGIRAILTREPGGSPGAEILRHVLLSGGVEPFGADAEAMVFAAARRDHLRATIVPALERGEWVICDRFADSTRVYQGVAGAVDISLISALERLTVGADAPDLTLILDLPPKIGLARAAARNAAAADRFERQDLAFHTKLRKGFLALAASEPQRCVTINASGDADHVAGLVEAAVAQHFALQAGPVPA